MLADALSAAPPVAVAVNVDANNDGSASETVNVPFEATAALPSHTHALAPVSATCTFTVSPAVKPRPLRTTVSPAAYVALSLASVGAGVLPVVGVGVAA